MLLFCCLFLGEVFRGERGRAKRDAGRGFRALHAGHFIQAGGSCCSLLAAENASCCGGRRRRRRRTLVWRQLSVASLCGRGAQAAGVARSRKQQQESRYSASLQSSPSSPGQIEAMRLHRAAPHAPPARSGQSRVCALSPICFQFLPSCRLTARRSSSSSCDSGQPDRKKRWARAMFGCAPLSQRATRVLQTPASRLLLTSGVQPPFEDLRVGAPAGLREAWGKQQPLFF